MRLRFFGNRAIRLHDEAPAGVKIFSQPELRAPSHAAGIKSSEELLDDRPAFVKFLTPYRPPDPRVEFKTSEMLSRSDGGTREFRGNATEIIPKEYSIADILEGNRKLWQQGPIAPAVANVMERDLLRAANKRNQDFWGAR
ncbi:MAG TPA: hypothetical protein VK709_13820 [Candidatus Saccharimonadales bacterium]|jgi:hypothetical protein|nr:hypothetical protein [Candidatus Saccharimonadales bacterium]